MRLWWVPVSSLETSYIVYVTWSSVRPFKVLFILWATIKSCLALWNTVKSCAVLFLFLIFWELVHPFWFSRIFCILVKSFKVVWGFCVFVWSSGVYWGIKELGLVGLVLVLSVFVWFRLVLSGRGGSYEVLWTGVKRSEMHADDRKLGPAALGAWETAEMTKW